jgi:hypothetical protein
VVGSLGYVVDHVDDFVVLPGPREFGLPGYVGVPAVSAAFAVSVAIKDVNPAAGAGLTEPGHVGAELGE